MDNTQQPQQPQNQISKKQIIYAAIAVVVIILLVIFLRPDSANGPTNLPTGNEPSDPKGMQGEQVEKTDDSSDSIVNASDEYSGVLQQSDNPAIGNLMLLQPERNIYLFSSRDFSSLYGKKVKLVTEGGLEQFRLIDIVEVE